MSFNFGAFAGAAAKSGMDTYSTLAAIESQKKRDALVELQTKEAEQAMKGREALRSAIAEQGGEKTFTPNFGGTGGMDSNDVAPTPVTQTPTERMSRSTERAIQLGADPVAVMQYKNAARQDINADSAQKVFDWMQGSNKAVADKGLVKAAEEYLIPQYNSNKGLLNDGMTAKVVSTKAGPIVQFADAQGNIQHNMTKPLTLETFGQARDLVGSSMLMASGPEHFYKGQELGLKGREVAAKEADVKSSGEYRRALGGKASQTQGQAMNEKITALGAVYRRADPNLSVEAAEKKAAQELVKSPDARADLVTAADVNKFLETHADAPEMKVKGKDGKMELRPLEERIGIARRALGGGAAPAASGKLAQVFASEGDPFAENKTKTEKTAAKKADTAMPVRPEAPARNMYLEQMAQADARRKAAIEARMQREADEEREAALADERAAANRRAIGANFNTLYGGTR